LIKGFEDRTAKGDAEAMVNLAGFYRDGDHGLATDEAKSLELTHNAAALGSSQALGLIGCYFLNGDLGVTRDAKKAMVYLEDAAKRGDRFSRDNLGSIAETRQQHDLAIRHYKLAAAGGEKESMKRLWNYFSLDKMTKAELEETLKAHKEACDEMNSEERERYDAWKEAKAGNDAALKAMYGAYYLGLITAKELRVTLKAHGSGDIDTVTAILSKASQKQK
jgi:TPR repeat protein